MVQNEEALTKLNDALPFKILEKEIAGDAAYIKFPLLGGLKVQSSALTVPQVFAGPPPPPSPPRTDWTRLVPPPVLTGHVPQVLAGGLIAGAAGEFAKDFLVFPLDTIRVRLMTKGSFDKILEESPAAAPSAPDSGVLHPAPGVPVAAAAPPPPPFLVLTGHAAFLTPY